jgi:alpha-mannosidase
VGHAHIDIAWLWPIREGRRKAARTFATQLALLDQYPGYVFGASQPQLYAFVEQDHPGLFARVRAAVDEGRWEPQGAMWVEADCNLPGGESLVRQVLHGKNYFRDRFGVDVRHLWLPDVFGYSAALPQILRRAGVDVLLTQKLSWSQFNRFPHTTFRWRGIDGSEVLVHFPPEDSYNSEVRPEDLCRAESRFEERDCLDGMLCLFGIGDGGGGPREEFLERARRRGILRRAACAVR